MGRKTAKYVHGAVLNTPFNEENIFYFQGGPTGFKFRHPSKGPPHLAIAKKGLLKTTNMKESLRVEKDEETGTFKDGMPMNFS